MLRKRISCAPHLTTSDKKYDKYSPASGIFTSLALIYLKFIFIVGVCKVFLLRCAHLTASDKK